MGEMTGKTVVVTGANTGIGRATAEELARRGASVVMVCRSRERGEQARAEIAQKTGNAAVELVVADLSSLKQTRAAAGDIKAKHPAVNVLVNNAGVFLPKREVTEDGLEKTFVTNYLSHFLLTQLLLPALKAGAPARIVNVATLPRGIQVDLDDLQLEKGYSFMKAVGASKMSQLLFTRELARRLDGAGVTVNALHPGLVKTPLLDDINPVMRVLFHLFSTRPEKGARTPVWLATAPEVAASNGKLYAGMKEKPYAGQALDDALAKKLWEKSAALTGVPA